ncbi:unnamed protein product [Clonostachys rosea]|uniref:Zn(2)-C6 fungal-type domain-containing protein n=1 Tax=Bionectria ochroleuca TaxID=29856 RepID=A0ABY6U1U5_BIOOC|nr:unnamed protein product [Clonostachys rosea]
MPPRISKKRSKTHRACVTCRNQKKKCSGTKPCDHCSRLRRWCTFEAEDQQSHSTPRGNGQQLEDDIIGTELLPSIHDVILASEPLEPSLGHVEDVPTLQAGNEADIDVTSPEVSNSRGFYSTEASRRGSMEPTSKDPAGNAVGPISAYTWVQRAFMRLNKAKRLQENKAAIYEAATARITEYGDANPGGEPQPLPLHEIMGADHHWLQKLTDCFFERACATYRYLHRPTVNSWVQSLASNDIDSLTPAQVAVLCSLLAHGRHYLFSHESSVMRFTESTVLDCERLLATAKLYLDQERGAPTLESIQARLVLVHFLLSSGRPSQAWFTFGLAVQLSLAMGLHQRRPRRDDPSIFYREMSCRVFWSVYATDKYLSIVLGRPTLLHDDGITQRYPSGARDELLSGAVNSAVAEHEEYDSEIEATVLQAKLCRIISQVISSNYKMGTSTLLKATAENNARLEDWQRQVPLHLSGAVRPSSLNAVFQRQATVLRLFYHHAIMLTNRPLLLQSFTQSQKPSSADASSIAIKKGVDACVSSAIEVVERSIQFATEGQRFAVFWFTQNVAFIAISILYLSILRTLASKTGLLPADDERLLSQAHQAHQCLAEASQGNSPGLRYAVVLEELRKEIDHQLRRQKTSSAALNVSEQVPNEEGCLTNAFNPAECAVSTVTNSTGYSNISELDFEDFNVEDTSLFWPDFDVALLNNAFIGNSL